MRIYDKIMIALALAAMSAPVSSCTGGDGSSSPKVVVIHSYTDRGREGEEFRSLMSKSFRRHGLRPETEHIYLDLMRRVEGTDAAADEDKSVRGRLEQFRPDVILVNDDLAFEYVKSRQADVIRLTPTVFAGVSVPQFDSRKFPLMCGFSDPIDLEENCRIGLEVTGRHDAAVELDFSASDDALRAQMPESIPDITLHYLSMRNPEANCAPGEPESAGYANTRSIMESRGSMEAFAVQVKFDIFSNDILVLSPSPDVTAIREQFGEVPTRFICGYFTGIETQIEDQVGLAAKILKGENPASLGVTEHSKTRYMDWNAMKLMPTPLRYADWYRKYKIIGAPIDTDNLALFILMVLALIAAAVALWMWCYRVILRRREQRLVNDISSQWKGVSDRRRLVVHNSGQAFAHIKNGTISFFFEFAEEQGLPHSVFSVKDFADYVHPDSREAYDSLTGEVDALPQKGQTRLQLNLNGSDWHWWTVFYTRSKYGKSKEQIISGGGDFLTCMLVLIDNIVKQEEVMNAYILKEKEVSARTGFIADTTESVRKPAEALVEATDRLAVTSSSLDRMTFQEVVNTNINQIVSLLGKASLTAEDKMDEVRKPSISRLNVSKLISSCYLTCSVLRKDDSELRFVPADRPDIMADTDFVKTSEMINGLVDSAFESAAGGAVTLSWDFNFKNMMIDVCAEGGGKSFTYHFPAAPGTPKDILI